MLFITSKAVPFEGNVLPTHAPATLTPPFGAVAGVGLVAPPALAYGAAATAAATQLSPEQVQLVCQLSQHAGVDENTAFQALSAASGDPNAALQMLMQGRQ